MSAKAAFAETELIRRLRVKYTERSGNGEAWAFIPGVRSAAAFDARRTIDAYAMGLWPSRGLSFYAFEIKSARSDWLRELKNPAKAEEFCELADYFYLVVGDRDIVKAGELPETWGLIAPSGTGLRIEVEATRLREATGARGSSPLPPGFSRSFTAALLRAASYVGQAQPEEVVEAERRARESERKLHEQDKERYDSLHGKVVAFQQESGIPVTGTWGDVHSPADVGKAVKAVLAGESEADRLFARLRRLRSDALSIAEHAEKLLPDAEGAVA